MGVPQPLSISSKARCAAPITPLGSAPSGRSCTPWLAPQAPSPRVCALPSLRHTAQPVSEGAVFPAAVISAVIASFSPVSAASAAQDALSVGLREAPAQTLSPATCSTAWVAEGSGAGDSVEVRTKTFFGGQSAPPAPALGGGSGGQVGARNPVAELAGLFGQEEDRETIEPFSLYGLNTKKFLIERLDGEKVVSRKKGFTVTTCTSAVRLGSETARFTSMTDDQKVIAAGNEICEVTEGQDLKPACVTSCSSSCATSIKNYLEEERQATGLFIDPKDEERLLKNCERRCTESCIKPGKFFAFRANYRG